MWTAKSVVPVMGLVLLASAVAESSPAPRSEEPESTARQAIEEVMVYGTKRAVAQSVQEVPGQVAAFDDNALDARQVVTLEDLSFATANVSMDQIGSVAKGIANFAIRGMGIGTSNPSIDPAVGVFVDGVYVGTSWGVVLPTFDLESVEIHKGPQGVLAGRNVTGGAVMLRTRRPSQEFKAQVGVGFETESQTTLWGSVQGGLIENMLSGKVSIFWEDDRGYFDNHTLNKDVGEQETFIVRPAVTFTPTDRFEVTAIFEYGEMDGDGTIAQDPKGFPPDEPSPDVDVAQDFMGVTDLEWYQFTLESHLDVGPGRFTSILGWRDVDQVAMADLDAIGLSLINSASDFNQDQFSAELRYNVSPAPWLDIIAGAYYFEQDFRSGSLDDMVDTLVPSQPGASGQEQETWAIFLNSDFYVTDTVTFNAGLRYTVETKDIEDFPSGTCEFTDRGTTVCFPDLVDGGPFADDRWTNWSPKIGVQWQVVDNAMVYAHWARAFRSGGYNTRGDQDLPGPPVATEPEEQNSFEIGLKSQWMEGRLTSNAAVFFNDFSDLQRESITTTAEQGFIQDIRNVADGEIIGAEADLSLRVTEDFSLSTSVGYLDGDYTKVTADLNLDGVIDDRDKDLEFRRLPSWTFTLGATYDYRIAGLGWLSVRADYGYRDRAFYDDANVSRFNAYDILNASLEFSPPSDRWRLTIYGKNLLDEAILGAHPALPFGALGSTYSGRLAKGRRGGVKFSVNM